MAENRVTQVGVEVFHEGVANARVTEVGVEVFHSGAANARVSMVGVEVFRSVGDYVPPVNRPGGQRMIVVS